MKTTRKIVSVLLAVAIFATLFAGMTLTAAAAGDTAIVPGGENYTEMQRAVVETAIAYHNRGKYVQYDSVNLTIQGKYEGDGADLRETDFTSPEDATEADTMFSVCSAFCFEVYYDAFGYQILGDPMKCKTNRLCAIPADDPMVVVKYDETGEDTGSKVMTDKTAALAKAEASLQPGDIVVGYGTTGHAMIYLGNYKNDGKTYIAHCWGKKYDIESGSDGIETLKDANGGAIRIEGAHKALFENGGSWALTTSAHATRFVILRPLNVLKSSQLTESAKARLKYSGLNIDRTTSLDRYQAVEPGKDIEVKIAIENCSGSDYKGLPVSETVPAGSTLKDSSILGGGSASGGKITWTLDVPAGKTVTVGYTVTAAGKRGDTLKFEGGSVGGVRSNKISVMISGKQLTASQVSTLQGIANRKSEFAGQGTDASFANAVYKTMLGIDPQIPQLSDIAQNGYSRVKIEGSTAQMFVKSDSAADTYPMLVPLYHGGTLVKTGGNGHARILDYNPAHLLPGDVLLRGNKVTSGKSGKYETYVFLGNGKAAYMDGGSLKTNDATAVLQKNFIYDFFVLARPSLAFDDMTVEAKASAALPFTDVKQSDWFYSFVSELYSDGTVNGMTATTFVPNGNLTYGQALKLIVCALGHGEQAKSGAHWASGYLTFAKEKGWLTGDVNLDGSISRLNFCKIAAKAKNLTAQPASNKFTDTSDPDVLALVNAGVINGMNETTFAPNATLTRAQISKIISLLRKL